MPELLSQQQRSLNMSRIRNRDTKPELLIRSMLHRMGYRFRVQGKGLPGRPDIVFTARSKVIQIQGCYWHRHNCTNGRYMPKTRTEFWAEKFKGNVERDKRNLKKLEEMGWSCLMLWECEIADDEPTRRRLSKFLGPTRIKQ
ncbi:MAG: very short patch repair endonuclease [Phycisphaerales bacterium]